jgi:diguanylate cyclase (GGDEF)-like protein
MPRHPDPRVRPPPGRTARCTAAALLALLALTLSGRAEASEPVAVQFGWHQGFQYAGYYVARERGYYRDAGFEVELRHGGPGAIRPVDAVTQGRAQFGVGNAGLAVDRMDGAPVVAIAALMQSSPAVWVVRGHRDPFDADAWRHLPRRLPFAEKDSSELLIALSLHRGAGAPTTADASAAERGVPVLQAAYLSAEAYRLKAAGETISVLNPRDLGVDFYSDVLFTSESLLRGHPGRVARFRAATLRGWAEAFADVEATARLVQDRYAPGVTLEALVHEGTTLKRLARPDAVELGHMTRMRWQHIATLQREHGFGRRPLDVEAFVFSADAPVDLRWPDPVRVALMGLLAALLLAAVHLLRRNSRLLAENRSLAHFGRASAVAELRFQFLMDVAPFPIALYELTTGTVVYANDRALTWAQSDDLAGGRVQDWIPPLAPDRELSARLLKRAAVRDEEIELPGTPGHPSRWVSVSIRAIEYDGQYCGFLALRDITARKAAEREVALLSEQRALVLRDVEQLQARLREASIRDALTGLHNRRYFEATVDREFARCRRERCVIGLLVVDADHFKRVNDRYGHAGGDEVLRALGAALSRGFRTEDVVCRFGGEEFVVLMPGADMATANARAEALVQAVGQLDVPFEGSVIRFTVSVGVAVCDPQRTAPGQLFAQADAAVYAAKSAGRNRVGRAPGAEGDMLPDLPA